MQVEDSSSEEASALKYKRPRITLEPYEENKKVEVIHDDGVEIYAPYDIMGYIIYTKYLLFHVKGP